MDVLVTCPGGHTCWVPGQRAAKEQRRVYREHGCRPCVLSGRMKPTSLSQVPQIALIDEAGECRGAARSDAILAHLRGEPQADGWRLELDGLTVEHVGRIAALMVGFGA